jgi:predicted ATPase/transcriptional regulator with XRE-family HTH domain
MAMDRSQAPFGERLRRLRVAAGLSQEALAERAGLSVQAIGALETGKRRRPYPHTVAALADALGLDERERAELAEARALASAAATRARPLLPRPRPFLIGREDEVRSVVGRLRAGADRLVTLTGPGGVGKTSLALAAADVAAEAFGGDVAFVPLAAIDSAALIAAEVAAALGLPTARQQSPDEVVQSSLRTRRMLLVLDNLEHLPGAAMWVADLLAACPEVTVLATSRAPLRLQDEREMMVAPLALPERAAPTPNEIHAAPAVRLFVERAPPPAFALTPANVAAVTAICRRVDGLPLAIELAAARVKVLSPSALLARLDRMLPLLTGGPQDQTARLRSMDAAIAWSYDLLDPDEQALFRRLAVFAGGFTLEAAESVAGEGGGVSGWQDFGEAFFLSPRHPDTPSPSTLDLIGSLVDKSLLRRLDEGGDEPRFGMLATIQEFGWERLAAAGEGATARAAHAAYFLALAEHAWPAFRQRTGQEIWLDRLEAERANLRAALVWLAEAGDAASLLRLAGALAWFWYIRGPLGEGRSWLERAIASHGAGGSPGVRTRAMVGSGLLAHFQGDDESARTWLEASLAEPAANPDPWLLAFARLLLGMVAEDHGDYSLAERRFSDALTRFQAAGDRSNAALALTHLGVAAWGLGDVARAAALCKEAMELQRTAEDDWGLSISLGYLGLLATVRGEYADAAAFHRESLQRRWEAAVWEDIAASLADLAALAAAVARPEQAARLFGAATAMREATGRLLSPLFPERVVFEQAEERARAALGSVHFAAAETDGRALSHEQAIAEATAFADEIACQGRATDPETG